MRELLPTWRFAEPLGSLFVWAQLPGGDAGELAQVALRHGVEIVPGSTMSPSGGSGDHIRLPFVMSEDQITEGVRRLARAWSVYAGAAEPRQARIDVLV